MTPSSRLLRASGIWIGLGALATLTLDSFWLWSAATGALIGKQAVDRLRQIQRRRVLDRNDADITLRYVDRREDLPDARNVLRVIGDDQGVVPRICGDRIVR